MNELSPTTVQPQWRAWLDRLRPRARAAAPFASGILAALLALLVYNWLFPPPQPLTAQAVSETVAQAMASATPPPAFSARVYQAIAPSLVLIHAHDPSSDDEGQGQLGTGVIVNATGAILTSLHVITGAAAIDLTFADGTQSAAVIASAQPENDIAVLAASQLPAQFVPATLGNPNALRIGDEAYAVGHPFGLYGSMSAGVISGFDRAYTPVTGGPELQGLIQIDAAVNPGNSGGPLLNRAGQVVGIVTALVNPTDQDVFIGIGFAVPIDVAGGAAGMPNY
jgi:S1-C subfamily serine protease